MAGARTSAPGTLTVRLPEELSLELDMYSAAKGKSRSEAARGLLANALFAEREGAFADLCRKAVRTELNRWLDSARMQKEYAADDFYDRLSEAMASEMMELRRVAGAALFASVSAAAHTDGSADGHEAWDEWYAEALRLAWTMGIEPTLDACRDSAGTEGGIS